MDPMSTAVAGVYLAALLAPFVQEDAAVVGAAAAAAGGAGDPVVLFALITVGLTLSDLWKYGAGRAAIRHRWAQRFTDKPQVRAAKDRVRRRLGLSLMAVRFIPGTRIPFYVASGLFEAPFVKFAIFIIISAMAYALTAFALFFALGEVAGQQARTALPFAALGVVAVMVTWQIRRARRLSAVEA